MKMRGGRARQGVNIGSELEFPKQRSPLASRMSDAGGSIPIFFFSVRTSIAGVTSFIKCIHAPFTLVRASSSSFYGSSTFSNSFALPFPRWAPHPNPILSISCHLTHHYHYHYHPPHQSSASARQQAFDTAYHPGRAAAEGRKDMRMHSRHHFRSPPCARTGDAGPLPSRVPRSLPGHFVRRSC